MTKGFAIHCHHDILVEYCYNYEERVAAIKRDKPLAEQEIRLRLFKILPDEALKDIPLEYREADQKYQEAEQKYQEAEQKWQEADQKYQEAIQNLQEANQKWQEAYQKWQEAYQKWPQADKDAFHKKWCGCKEWNGAEIIFEKVKED